jgi:hypothetical protein
MLASKSNSFFFTNNTTLLSWSLIGCVRMKSSEVRPKNQLSFLLFIILNIMSAAAFVATNTNVDSPMKSPTKSWGPMSPRKLVKNLAGQFSSPKKSPRKKSVIPPCIDEDAPAKMEAAPVPILFEFLDDDELLPNSPKSKSTMPKSESELQAEALLEKMRQDRDEQLAKEKELEKKIAEYQERHAVSLMMAPEDVEGCVDQIARLKRECEKIASAVSILDMHLLNLECDLEDARSEAVVAGANDSYSVSGGGGGGGIGDPSESQVCVDFSEHEHYRAEMVEILSPGRGKTAAAEVEE